MKVLLLGGTGNISTAITRQLLERGNEVVLFKRTPRVRRESKRRAFELQRIR